MIAVILGIIEAALTALAPLAPDVVHAITGGQDPAKAMARAREIAAGMPEREQHAGDTTAGGWDADLRQREAGGTGAPSVPADPYGSDE